jgi:pantoate kinase
MTARTSRVARAFAPGHVTGVFRADTRARDPRGRGSVGAGIVLELGARAEARFVPGPRNRLRVIAEGPGPWPISEEVARRLAPKTSGALTVRIAHELPVGQGFGMSAAGALATALAVADLTGRSRSEAVRVAHLADFFGRGGLGGVAALLGGGLEVRLRPGIPPFGEIVHRPFRPPLIVGVVGGPIPSPKVLNDSESLRRIRSASVGWERLARHASPDRFFRISERFTDRAGLASPPVARTVRALRRRGGRACQAMFGQSFFAMPDSAMARSECLDWLETEGVRAVEIRAATGGAHRLPPGRVEGPRIDAGDSDHGASLLP